MRIRTTCLALLVAAFTASCSGGDGDNTSVTEARETDVPTAATEPTTAGVDETTAPEATTASGGRATARPGPAATASTSGTGGTTQQAAQGGVNAPKPGKYKYVASGKQDQPPPATPATYNDRQVTIEVLEHKAVADGTEIKSRAGTDQGTQTTTTIWQRSRVLLTKVEFSSPQGGIECRFNTPENGIVITHVPIKAEKFARQEWKNDTCEGSYEQEYVRPETVTVKAGTFDAWVVKIDLQIRINFESQGGGPIPAGRQTIDVKTVETRWLSPSLGTEVKADSENSTSFGPNTSKGTSTRELVEAPK